MAQSIVVNYLVEPNVLLGLLNHQLIPVLPTYIATKRVSNYENHAMVCDLSLHFTSNLGIHPNAYVAYAAISRTLGTLQKWWTWISKIGMYYLTSYIPKDFS